MVETIFLLILDLFLYGSGKIVLPFISFGKWRADIKKSSANWLTGWPFFKRSPDGVLYFSYEGTILAGIAFWMTAIVTSVALLNL
jgi:hypothetical protein